MLVNKTYTEKMNDLAGRGIPFLFIIDFLARDPLIFPLDEVPAHIHFSLPGFPDPELADPAPDPAIRMTKNPVEYADYQAKFDRVQEEIRQGNTFLLNLTQPTQVSSSLTPGEIYRHSRAKYKLWVEDHFVVFSPETFIRIEGLKIATFPMKGTIDAAIAHAAGLILHDEKETAEHFTIVDLMRNDLSRVATGVKVNRFRYLEQIETHEKSILQVSSEVMGTLPEDFRARLGDLLFNLLPAGSISGAPKAKTLAVITETEAYDRGFYTGIFGVFDGNNLDSAVMIRFIEETPEGLIYKSGGGITHRSEPEKEYQELIDKVYVPIARNHQNP